MSQIWKAMICVLVAVMFVFPISAIRNGALTTTNNLKINVNAGMKEEKEDSYMTNIFTQINDNKEFVTNNNTSPTFDFKNALFENHTLSICIESMNKDTGKVVVNGLDTREPSIPFTWEWGDGYNSSGFFPQSHIYVDRARNYILKVTSHYEDGGTDEAELLIRFVPPTIDFKPLSPNISVIIPDHMINLESRMPGYGIPRLTYFDDSFFTILNRTVVEYVLSIASEIQMDFANNNVYLINDSFIQYLLKDYYGGAYTLWYTSPVAFVMWEWGGGSIPWSSCFHEMGHDVTLNSPADYYYGGKIDGNANAIFSESMAQIFQHATAYEIINNAEKYGLGKDLVFEIKQSAISSIIIVKDSYEHYINSGMNFCSWNDPHTDDDETFNTFMTIAYKFFEHAEKSGLGYRMPLKRMTMLLQTFCEKDRARYSQFRNSIDAETFRATLMVAALSFAFEDDLREEFRSLNFPVNDEIYEELINRPIIFNISIDKPVDYLYISDREVIKLPKNMTVVIGAITMEISVPSHNDVDEVEIYVDNELKETLTEKPYNWLWNEKIFGEHTIKAIAYDFTGKMAVDSREVWIFNL